MSRHIAPHRWGDAFAGRLGEREVATMELHAESCARCARARDRVNRASQSFPALRAQSSPDLSWDEVRARVHWSVSSEKRKRQAPARSRRLGVALGLAVAAAGGLALALTSDGSGPEAPRPAPVATAPSATPPPVRPAATPLGALAVRELGEQTLVDGLRTSSFAKAITAGTTLATGSGRLDLQFDDASALALGPSTTVKLTRFDSQQIELALVEGTLDVTVSRRAPDQRFLVTMGTRTVEVRGTQFRVREAGGASEVTCAHGKVAVRDASGEIEVGGARKVQLPARTQVPSVRTVELSGDELKALVAATPMTLPVWTDPQQLVSTSAPLEVATTDAREVRVDGLEVGQGPLVRVRVMPGRHTVETADAAGRFRRAGWVDVAAGAGARLDVHADATASTGGTAARKKQLHAGIDRARLAQCTRAIAKAGVTDTYVKIEIAIDETGAVGFLNVIDTDLPSATASCVREVLANVRFQPGPAATFRDKLDL